MDRKELRDRGVYRWLSDYREYTPGDHRRLAIVAEFWLREKEPHIDEIASALNEHCAEGCDFQFLTDEIFILDGTAYKLGVFTKRDG